jgi:hypothetical protein
MIDQPELISPESEWREYKRLTRILRQWRRLQQLKEEVLTDWLTAVERDDRTDPVMDVAEIDTPTRQQAAAIVGSHPAVDWSKERRLLAGSVQQRMVNA